MEKDLVKVFNEHSFKELLPVIESMLDYGELTVDGPLVSIWTAGWSEDEAIVHALRHWTCKHHGNYVGNVFAVSYFALDKDKKHDYSYSIVATPKEWMNF